MMIFRDNKNIFIILSSVNSWYLHEYNATESITEILGLI